MLQSFLETYTQVPYILILPLLHENLTGTLLAKGKKFGSIVNFNQTLKKSSFNRCFSALNRQSRDFIKPSLSQCLQIKDTNSFIPENPTSASFCYLLSFYPSQSPFQINFLVFIYQQLFELTFLVSITECYKGVLFPFGLISDVDMLCLLLMVLQSGCGS